MIVAIIGGKGNMGRRYSAILRYLGHDPLILDVEHDEESLRRWIPTSDAVIIATPTESHARLVTIACDFPRVPILCEKPLSLDLETVDRICDLAEEKGARLEMVNQYKFLFPSLDEDRVTSFNYWNHGKDSLPWDCISIVALAEGGVILQEDSPIWECQINGEQLNIADMDEAYIAMVEDWLAHPVCGTNYIRLAHQKVWEYVCAHQ